MKTTKQDNREIKIYSSTEYIPRNEEKVGNLKLKVISQWDWSTNPICFKTIYKGEPNEKTISFSLEKCIEVKEPGWTKWEIVKKITKGIKKELVKQGYILSESL